MDLTRTKREDGRAGWVPLPTLAQESGLAGLGCAGLFRRHQAGRKAACLWAVLPLLQHVHVRKWLGKWLANRTHGRGAAFPFSQWSCCVCPLNEVIQKVFLETWRMVSSAFWEDSLREKWFLWVVWLECTCVGRCRLVIPGHMLTLISDAYPLFFNSNSVCVYCCGTLAWEMLAAADSVGNGPGHKSFFRSEC